MRNVTQVSERSADIVLHVVHWFRCTFGDTCPDSKCPGTLQIYDNNVNRDYCSVCGRTERMFKEGVAPGRGSKERGYPC